MSTWLVTGGAGFIGGNFVRTFAHAPQQIVNLDALTYAGNLDNLAGVAAAQHRFVRGDIADRALVANLLREQRPTAVVNFAAESHVDRSIDGPGEFIQTNVVGTLHLLQSALEYWRTLSGSERDGFRFLHVSTDEVYGSLGAQGRFSETSPYQPNSPYSASKAASDHLVRAFHHTYGLPTLTTNCSNNYGPYQFPEKLIPLMIQKALRGEALPVYGDGRNVRDWLHVEDHCTAIAAVLARGRVGEVYNIGGDAEMENLQVVEQICALLDAQQPLATPRTSLIRFVTDRPGHDRRYAIDASKTQQETGWKTRHSFASGIRDTVDWYMNNQPWCARIADGSYRGERLGASA
jgi:dTDP-glucose 4,6-dehydratase